MSESNFKKDFFISYNRFDKQWAEWIAWTLEEAGYSVAIQAWDFRPGGNFVLDMQRAAAESEKTIAVLSETYLKSAYTQPEWAAAFANDPSSLKRKLIPVRVKPCQPDGMLQPLVYVDLVGVSQADAKQRILDMVKDRVKPDTEPAFPGATETDEPVEQPSPVNFPPDKPRATNKAKEIKLRNLEKRMAALEEDYNASIEQLDATNNAVSRKRLERQISTIEVEITEIAEKIEALEE